MKLFRKRDFITVGFILVFSAAAITLFYTILKPIEILPIYQPNQVNEKLVDSSVVHISKYHKISDFELTNQNGQQVTQEFYNNKIYVADFFFTTCQDICPIMTKNMYRLQEELKNDNDILFLSHTVIPEVDTVQQLKKYSTISDGDLIQSLAIVIATRIHISPFDNTKMINLMNQLIKNGLIDIKNGKISKIGMA